MRGGVREFTILLLQLEVRVKGKVQSTYPTETEDGQPDAKHALKIVKTITLLWSL